MYILYSLCLIGLGVVVEIYTYQFVKIFGHLSWAERYLGSGGSYLAWRLIGILFILGGIYWIGHPDIFG